MTEDVDGDKSGALTKIENALVWAYEHAIEGFWGRSGAEECAQEHLRSKDDAEAAINALISWSIWEAGGAGFLTNIGGLITLPVAIPANVASVFFIQLRMIAAIAHIRGYDARSHKVRTLVIACLCGTAASDALKDVGINVGSKLTMQALNRIPGTALVKINQAVGFRLLTRAGTTGVVNLSKLVPLIGGFVSGGIDATTTSAVGQAAKELFSPLPSSETGS
jgi:uncharacterized protein (DUF697 family)